MSDREKGRERDGGREKEGRVWKEAFLFSQLFSALFSSASAILSSLASALLSSPQLSSFSSLYFSLSLFSSRDSLQRSPFLSLLARSASLCSFYYINYTLPGLCGAKNQVENHVRDSGPKILRCNRPRVNHSREIRTQTAPRACNPAAHLLPQHTHINTHGSEVERYVFLAERLASRPPSTLSSPPRCCRRRRQRQTSASRRLSSAMGRWGRSALVKSKSPVRRAWKGRPYCRVTRYARDHSLGADD